MAQIFLPKKEANAMRCASCQSYLSFAPIWIREDYQPLCARCNLTPEKAKCRAYFYEIVAKYMIFPCRYDIFGCDAQLPWNSVQSHELCCKWAPMKCPAFECNQEIRLESLHEHFIKIHPDLIMDNNVHKIPSKDKEDNFKINRLYIWNNSEYFVQISYHQKECYIDIAKFDDSVDLFYDLTFYDETRTKEIHMRQAKVNTYFNKSHDYLKMQKLDGCAIKKLLSEGFLCTFVISSQKTPGKETLNEKLLSDLECPIC